VELEKITAVRVCGDSYKWEEIFFEVGCSEDFLYESVTEAIVQAIVPALWVNSLAD
jgi:hypothetical protein